jgi:hypothetical protein
MEAGTIETGDTERDSAPDGDGSNRRDKTDVSAPMETDLLDYEEDEPDMGVLDAESGDELPEGNATTATAQDKTDQKKRQCICN